jgi:hypothetical protein
MSSASTIGLPAEADYFSFRTSAFRQSIGLKELSAESWIEIDSHYPAQISLKESLFRAHENEVFQAMPGTEYGCAQILKLVMDHLTRCFPYWFMISGSTIRNLITGQIILVEQRERNPLQIAAGLVQEDLCLMQPSPNGYQLRAACVCFPSRWSLHEKMGNSMRGIHGPVPYYIEQIGAGSDQFLTALRQGRLVWRVNWSLHDGPDLFRPTMPPMWPGRTVTSQNAGDEVWLRVERQTLRRLEGCDDILFTIRTHVYPLRELKRNVEAAAALAEALRQWPKEVVEYKGCQAIVEPTVLWLESLKNNPIPG